MNIRELQYESQASNFMLNYLVMSFSNVKILFPN